MPVRACVDQVSDRDFGLTNRRHHPHRQFVPADYRARSGGKFLIYESPRRRKGGSRLKLALFGPHAMSAMSPECVPKLTSADHSKYAGSRPRLAGRIVFLLPAWYTNTQPPAVGNSATPTPRAIGKADDESGSLRQTFGQCFTYCEIRVRARMSVLAWSF
jgi:hypothetical protein